MDSSSKRKFLLIAIIVALVAAAYFSGATEYLTLESFQNNTDYLRASIAGAPFYWGTIYFVAYVLITGLSLPGAAVMTLGAGALFGFWLGLLMVSFASSIGATLAFLVSRFLLRDWVEQKFAERVEVINRGLEKDGAMYLFSLRLIPLFPFFVINLVMGLTKLPVKTFYWVSQLGMLAGTAAYVNAGTELGQIRNVKDVLSPGLIGAFVIVGLLPFISKFIFGLIKNKAMYKNFSKPKSFDYNMVVIGAGSAGLVTSYIAAALKAKVALIEKNKMGGDCLNTGCVPSKALIRSAKVLNMAKRAKNFGLNSVEVDFEFSNVMERVQRIIKQIEPHDSVERYTDLGVECINSSAKILSPYEVQVEGRTLTTKAIVVATGARPFVPPIKGLDSVEYLTSDTIWEIRELPKRLIVLGGGPIGSELAQCFRRLGSEVTIVETNDCVLSREDADVSDFICERFSKEGIEILSNHRAEEVVVEGQKKFLLCSSNGITVKVPFDSLLLAVGRKANTTGFGLEELGVTISERGTIEADELLRTNYPNIYVAGDVAGPYQFTHVAAHQAWYAAVNALLSPFKTFKADYRVIPWCTFTDPEVAHVGLNEKQAKEKGLDFEVTKYGIDDLDRAIADSEDHGFVKVITMKGKDKILGATIVGNHAGDLLAEYVLAMKYKIGLNKILGTIHTYPTMAEANKFAAGVWKKANAPTNVLDWVRKFHSWRRGG